MKRILLFFFLSFLGFLPAAHGGSKNYVLQAGVTATYKNYGLSEVDSGFSDKQAYGLQATLLEEQAEGYSYGAYYHRTQSTSNKTFYYMDGFGAAFESFWGNKANLSQKLPIWDKLWLRWGSRLGYYRAFISRDDPGQLSEVKQGTYYQGEGLFLHFFAGFGIGRLGSIEYTWRLHQSGGFNNSPLNKAQIAYVQNWDFNF